MSKRTFIEVDINRSHKLSFAIPNCLNEEESDALERYILDHLDSPIFNYDGFDGETFDIVSDPIIINDKKLVISACKISKDNDFVPEEATLRDHVDYPHIECL